MQQIKADTRLLECIYDTLAGNCQYDEKLKPYEIKNCHIDYNRGTMHFELENGQSITLKKI